MLKLDSLLVFTTIAEAGSISEAARRLQISKSVASERLAELESTLGAVEHSASWRLTRPLRGFMALVRRVRGGGSAGSEL